MAPSIAELTSAGTPRRRTSAPRWLGPALVVAVAMAGVGCAFSESRDPTRTADPAAASATPDVVRAAPALRFYDPRVVKGARGAPLR
jgi:hypothetical protein